MTLSDVVVLYDVDGDAVVDSVDFEVVSGFSVVFVVTAEVVGVDLVVVVLLFERLPHKHDTEISNSTPSTWYQILFYLPLVCCN